MNKDCITPIRAFADNYIWAISVDDGDAWCIVDPGDAAPVLSALQRHEKDLAGILITHHHADHTGGILGLIGTYKVPVFGPVGGHIPGITDPVAQGDRITLPRSNYTFSVLEIPGHTRDHIAYFGEGVLFCGDTLFLGGCGRLFEGTPDQMWASLQKLRSLPDETLVYCAHEYTEENLRFATTVEPSNTQISARYQHVCGARAHDEVTIPERLLLEKYTNPFLRVDTPEIIDAARQWSGQSQSTPEAVFATIRRWKDRF